MAAKVMTIEEIDRAIEQLIRRHYELTLLKESIEKRQRLVRVK